MTIWSFSGSFTTDERFKFTISLLNLFVRKLLNFRQNGIINNMWFLKGTNQPPTVIPLTLKVS